MFSWIEAIYYTLIQLAKVNQFNAFLLVSLVGYPTYQGIKVLTEPLRDFIQLIRGLIDDRECIVSKGNELSHFWKYRHEIDWKSARKGKSKQFWNLMKRLSAAIPSFLFLLIGNLLFRLIYKLPFVKQDRKRFDKEMKPLLYFKNYRSFVIMGLGFSFIALILTSYLVTVLRAAIRFLYFSLMTLRDSSQVVTFNVDSLLIQNLFNAKVFYSTDSSSTNLPHWFDHCLAFSVG